MNVIFLEPAKLELQKAIDYYNGQKEDLGEEFAQEVETTVQRICLLPGAWTRLSDTVRRCRTNRFPYGLVYHQKGDDIIILAVMHLRRKPGYWKERLKDGK